MYTRALLLRRITSFCALKAVPTVERTLCYVCNSHWILLLLVFVSIGMYFVISIAIYCADVRTTVRARVHVSMCVCVESAVSAEHTRPYV